MRLDKARYAWDRANRMMDAFLPYAQSSDEHAFEDRLPYILDLLAGVRRQIAEFKPTTPAFQRWWADEKTADRLAITAMRDAQLKRLESGAASHPMTTMQAQPGTVFFGKRVNGGDILSWQEWQFLGGDFDGQRVIDVLTSQLADLALLIDEAERRLTQDVKDGR